jgi:hypothetical protein
MSTRLQIYELKIIGPNKEKRGKILIVPQTKVGRQLNPNEVLQKIKQKYSYQFKDCSFELEPYDDLAIYYADDDFSLVGKCPEHGNQMNFCGKCGRLTTIEAL